MPTPIPVKIQSREEQTNIVLLNKQAVRMYTAGVMNNIATKADFFFLEMHQKATKM